MPYTGYGQALLCEIKIFIVVFSTIAVFTACNGFGDSMKALHWLVAMRFVMEVGIGAGHPLSASICTE